MFVEFCKMPLNARVWVFHSNQSFFPNRVMQIRDILNAFCSGWVSHQKPIKSSFKIIEELFVVVAVDHSLNKVSGCSIDAMHNCVKNIEEEFSCNLTERTNLTYYKNKQRFCCEKNQIKQLYSTGVINDETQVVNTLVATINEVENNWHIPFKKCWAFNLVN